MDPLLKEYIERCNKASNRTRYVIIVIIIASTIIFTSFWNSRQNSWTNLRLKLAKDGLRLKVWEPAKRNILTDPNEKECFDKAWKFAKVRDILNPNRLEELVDELNRIQASGINNIQVSFLGINFDVNDLGLFGGFTFTVLLFWLRFSLIRELNNLKITFEETGFIKDSQKFRPHRYNLLSMVQVLTVPPLKTKEAFKTKVIRKIPVSLFLLPLLTQIFVLSYDIDSFEFGKSISISNTIFQYAGSAFFLFCIFILTLNCIKIFNAIWKYFRKSLIE